MHLNRTVSVLIALADGKYARIEFSFERGQEKPLRIVTLLNTTGARLLDAGYRPQKVFE